MKASLQAESEKLARSWSQHESGWLREYLVAGVEDPRINVQSILTRHFLLHVTGTADLGALMEEEYRFSAVMNWLVAVAEKCTEHEELESVLFALRRGSDNVEGLPIPAWAGHTFSALPREVAGVRIPNYLESFIEAATWVEGKVRADPGSLDTFCRLWREVLGARGGSGAAGKRVSVLEPACGSANDYRFFDACGVAPLIDYTGFDICAANVANARRLFPGARFESGNVFEIDAPERAYDYTVVHDLFEHLSLEGLEAAVRELCRVTRLGMAVGFFQMDEIPEHNVRPVEEYHWNLLSMGRTRQMFRACGFEAQVLHIPTLLREKTGCDRYHNPNAYTFVLQRAGGSGSRFGSDV